MTNKSNTPMIPDHIYPSRGQANFALGTLMVGYIFSFIDRQILSLMVEPIKHDLMISDFQISLLQGFAFAIFFCVLGIPCGRLADRYSRKHLIAGGVFLWSIMTVACGLANSFEALFLARVGVGVGEAALAPAGYSLLADAFRKERLVRAMSIFTLGGMLGGGLAFLVGGQVIDYVTHAETAPFGISDLKPWQFTFIAVGAPGVLVALLFLAVHEPIRHGRASDTTTGFRDAMLYLWGRRSDYWPIYAAPTCMAVLSYGALAWFPTHVIRNFGLTPGKAGLYLGLIHIVGPIAGATFATMLTERYERRNVTDAPFRTIRIAALGTAVCFTAPLLHDLTTMLFVWMIGIVFANAYYGVSVATLQRVTPPHLRATNSAVFTLVVSIGGLAIGSALIGGIADIAFAGDKGGIGKSLTLVGVTFGLMAALIAHANRTKLGKLLAG